MAELSAKSGIGWATIQAIEMGRTPGNIITRHRLSDALHVPFRIMWPDSAGEWGELFEAMKREAIEELKADAAKGKVTTREAFKRGFALAKREKAMKRDARKAQHELAAAK